MQIDENIYTECRIAEFCYRKGDAKSLHVPGKLIVFDKKTL
jgi:hypothetical protein